MDTKRQLGLIADVLGLNIEWRQCYQGRDHQEAYVDGKAVRARLTKLLGRPKVKVDSDQRFWTYPLSGKLKALGVKEIFVEKYKGRSEFLCVSLYVPKRGR